MIFVHQNAVSSWFFNKGYTYLLTYFTVSVMFLWIWSVTSIYGTSIQLSFTNDCLPHWRHIVYRRS